MYFGPGGDGLLADEAFLDARGTDGTAIDMAAWPE